VTTATGTSDMVWKTRTVQHRAYCSSRSPSSTTTREKWPPTNRNSISNICQELQS
jgi:hypothetical protein